MRTPAKDGDGMREVEMEKKCDNHFKRCITLARSRQRERKNREKPYRIW